MRYRFPLADTNAVSATMEFGSGKSGRALPALARFVAALRDAFPALWRKVTASSLGLENYFGDRVHFPDHRHMWLQLLRTRMWALGVGHIVEERALDLHWYWRDVARVGEPWQ